MAKTIAVEATIPATITLNVMCGDTPMEMAAAIIRQGILNTDEIDSLAGYLRVYTSQKRREEFHKNRGRRQYDEED